MTKLKTTRTAKKQQKNNSANASRSCTFLSRRCTNGTQNFLISHARFMELVNTTQKFSFSFSLLSDSILENFANFNKLYKIEEDQ